MTQPDTTAREDLSTDSPPVFLDYGDLERMVRVTRRTIQRMVQKKTFPQPIYLTERNPVFLETEVHEWMLKRVQERDKDG